jgi:hypothetical protein
MRGVYYKESATRVEQPMLDAQFDTSPTGIVNAHVLADVITSASAATGANGKAFTEHRYEAGVGYTHLMGALHIGADGKYSTESDYFSGFLLLHASYDLARKNTVVNFSEGRGHDTITNGIATSMGSIGTPGVRHTLDNGLTSASVVQLISPTTVADLTYDLMDSHGYQANVYRLVFGGATPVGERVPQLRLRNAIHIGARQYIPPTNTAVMLGYRLYFDDWGITAHTVEGRVDQEIIPGLEVRVRYRFYTQGHADFWKETYVQADIDNPKQYLTADTKLSAFSTHTFGAQIIAMLSLFGVHGQWGQARVEAQFDRLLQNNDFGNAVEAHVALVVPFAY